MLLVWRPHFEATALGNGVLTSIIYKNLNLLKSNTALTSVAQ